MPVLMFILHEQVIKLQTPKLPKIISFDIFSVSFRYFDQPLCARRLFATIICIGRGTTFAFTSLDNIPIFRHTAFRISLQNASLWGKRRFQIANCSKHVRKSMPNFGKVSIFEKNVEISSNFHIRSIAKICLAPFSNVIWQIAFNPIFSRTYFQSTPSIDFQNHIIKL